MRGFQVLFAWFSGFVFLLLVAGCFQQAEPPSLTVEEFSERLLSFQNASVFMNVTGASRSQATAIYTCGVDLSGSIGALGLAVSPYAVEGETCTALDNRTLLTSQCLLEAQGYKFFVQKGANKTRFYNDYATIEVPENYVGKCTISLKEGA